MDGRRKGPYGSWKSPITSESIASGTVRLGQIVLDDEEIFWSEIRPAEGGRTVVVRWTADGRIADVTPLPFNVRTRVHEYGGGAFAVFDGSIYFANFADQRIYRQDPGAQPHPITPESEQRFADLTIDRHRHRILCVREDHTVPERGPVNTVVGLDCDGGTGGEVLLAGNDFYSSPRLNCDGSRLAWITWNHPNMPWDGTELWIGELDRDGSVGHTERVAGGLDESVVQPEWSPDGLLYFIYDRSDWWNLYRWRDGRVESVYEKEADFGRPPWRFGASTYAFESSERIVCVYTEQGSWQLASLETATGKLEPITTPYTDIRQVRASPGRVVCVAGSPTVSSTIVRLDLATHQFEVLRRSSRITVDAGYLSIPRPIEFPTEHGLTAHAFFYAPRNRDFTGPSDEWPPLLVTSHGGPTSATSTTLSWRIQYWTSRGFAVLDVNYGGSTGYGRAYRQRLYGQWGVVDVEDCVNAARYLVTSGEVDGTRLAIRGGSAGGYTTLCALTFRRVFHAGTSYFGVSDLEALVRDTHKFESRYLDRLVGPYPERRDLYRARSPIHFVDQIACPMILFHGLEDRIVPPNQAELIVEALRQKGLPVAYLTFPDEQHGFRHAKNIKRSLDAELYFYSQIFSFKVADSIESMLIENL